MADRTCLDCGSTIPAGTRCDTCGRAAEKRRHNPAYGTAEYRRARNAAVADWIRRHGNVCPGDGEHDAHESFDLTADHPDPLSAGGALVQDFAIRCRSSNSRRGPGRPERPRGLVVV